MECMAAMVSIMNYLYPTEIAATANNLVMGIGKAIGSFSTVIIGLLMSKYSISVVMGFLSTMYLLSFAVMLLIPGLKQMSQHTQSNKNVQNSVD